MRKFIAIVSMLAAVMLAATSCGDNSADEKIAVQSITLDPAEATLEEEQALSITAVVMPENAEYELIEWSSDNSAVASVSEHGVVTALTPGKAVITASVEGKTAVCAITVNKKIIDVQSVTLDKKELSLTVGDESALAASVTPDNATNASVQWSSSAPDVATVDQNGKVTAVAEGQAQITASAGEHSDICTVTVTKAEVPVTSVKIFEGDLTIDKGTDTLLTAKVLPDDATDKTVTWTSSDENIVKVDQNGNITAVGVGEATVTASAGDVSGACRITVKEPVVIVESVSISETSVTLKTGENTALSATVRPDNATDKTVTWSSEDTKIATVDQSGKVTAVAVGTTTVTASAGNKFANCTVTVVSSTIEVESVTLSKSALDMKTGQTATLAATVLPENATDKTVAWTSSDTKIVTVDQNGNVTAVTAGTATITASAGNSSATCTVTVTEPAQLIDIPDAAFKKYLVENFDTDKDGGISVEEAAAITSISCSKLEITSLEGIDKFTGLQTLDCSGNKISGLLDMSANKALTTLNCSGNQITSLNISECQQLASLDCSDNQAAFLNLTGNKALKTLNCSKNKLSILYLADNAALESLNCSQNTISTLNLSSNKALKTLNCAGNKISSLDASELSALVELDCSGNGSLTSLSANNLASLTKLDCGSCNLSTLMVNGNAALTYLDFSANSVAGIWLGLNKKLTNLYCSGNKMTYLNLADNTELTFVICGKQDKQLTLKLPESLKSKWDTWKNIPNNAGVTLE